MAQVKLLDLWASPPAMRVRLPLAENRTEYEAKEEDFRKKSPLLLQMNPVHKKIPVLIHNGKPICESMIIVEYIDEVWKDKSPLLPSDAHERARSRLTTLISVWYGHQAVKTKKLVFEGESFGFVDVVLVPFYGYFYTYETFGNFSFAKECPRLVAWGKKCSQKESVATTLPDPYKIYEFVLEYKKKLGME